jgi:hypothetical protein
MIDINLEEGAPTINSEVDLIIQQVDLLFDTAYKEVHGAPDFGTRYEDFLFNLNMSNDAIAYQIKNDLASLNLFGFSPSVNVTILEGTLNDIILVQISLERGSEYYEKTYQIQ